MIASWSGPGMGLCNNLYGLALVISYKIRFPESKIYSFGNHEISWTNGLCLRDIRELYQSSELSFITETRVNLSSFRRVATNISSFNIDKRFEDDVEFDGVFWDYDNVVSNCLNRDALVRIFKPNHLVEYVTKKFSDIFNNSFVKIGLSVRRGDFVTLPDPRVSCFYKDNNGIDYYLRKVKELTSKESNPLIVVVSDDIQWCRENLTHLHPNMAFVDTTGERYKAFYDMISLSICKKVIKTPRSTFSQWGHILSEEGDLNNINKI